MEKQVRKFSSFKEMNRSDRHQAVSMTPEQRLQNLTPLKRQYLAMHGMTPKDLDGHLKASGVKKVRFPWLDDETT